MSMSIRAPQPPGVERLLPRPAAILGALIAPLIVSAVLSLTLLDLDACS